MAEETKHIIKLVADSSQAKQYIRNLREMKKVSQNVGTNIGKGFVNQSVQTTKAFDKQGNAFLKMSGTFTKGNEQISVGYNKTTQGVISNSVKVTKGLNTQATGIVALTKKYGLLAVRALAVIPIWFALRTAFIGIISVTKNSIKFLIDWEFQLAQIRLVGEATEQQIKQLSSALLNLSVAFGVSNEELGEGAKLYIQQGRAITEIIPLMKATAKLSLLTGRTIVQSVEDLTAVLKAYELEATDATQIVDTITNVMLNHAITAGDLAQAYKQVASTASTLGVSLASLTGFITAIKTVTRDTGSKVGLSLRTMFARISTSSAEALQVLTKVPFFLDETGKVTHKISPNMRNLESIINEIALSFNDLTNAQQASVGKLIGGVRRLNQAIALFKNFDEAIDATNDALFSFGKSQSAVDVLLETSKLKVKQLSGAWSEFVDTVGNTGFIKGSIQAITNEITALQTLLAPDQTLKIKIDEEIDTKIDEINKKIQSVKGTLEALRKLKSLSEILARNPEKINDITSQANKLFRGIIKGSKQADISLGLNIDTKGVNNQIKELESKKVLLGDIQVTAQIGAETFEAVRAIKDLGFDLTNIFRGRLAGIQGQFQSLFENLQIGKVDTKEIDKFLEFLQKSKQFGVINKIQLEATSEILDEIIAKNNTINNTTERRVELSQEFHKEEEKIAKNTATSEGIRLNLLKIEQDAIVANRDKLETIKEELSLLRENEIILSKQQQNQLENLEKQELQLEASRKLLQIREKEQRVLGGLRQQGASALTLAVQELAFAKARKAHIEELIPLETKIVNLRQKLAGDVTQSLIKAQSNILKSITGSNAQAILFTIEQEKQLGIERQGLDLLNQRLELIQAIRNESKKSRQDRLKALENEIKKEAKIQDPRFQRGLDVKEQRLTARAEELGIDTDAFLKIPGLEDLPSDMTSSITQGMLEGTTPLISALRTLTQQMISDASRTQNLVGQQRALTQTPSSTYQYTNQLSQRPLLTNFERQQQSYGERIQFTAGDNNINVSAESNVDKIMEQVRAVKNKWDEQTFIKFRKQLIQEMGVPGSSINKAQNESNERF